MFFVLPIGIAILIGLGAAVKQLTSQGRGPVLDVTDRSITRPSLDAERVFLHILCFAGLMGALYAVAGLLSLSALTLSLHSATVLSSLDARTRVSYYLAALIVGGPLWFGCWTLVRRRLSRSIEARGTFEHRLFLAAVFGVTAIGALVGLHSALHAILSLPDHTHSAGALEDLIVGGVQVLVWGGAWFAYARFGRQEWRDRSEDKPYDFALYVVSGVALAFATIGLWEGIRQVISSIVTSTGNVISNGSATAAWSTWGPIVSWLLPGTGVWVLISRYDLNRPGHHLWRVRYLYLILLLAAPTALGAGIDVLYELFRRTFGYRPDGGTWLFLSDALPPLLIGGGFWMYHWILLRRQPEVHDGPAGAIPWSRRPAIAGFVLLGLAVGAPAITYLLWLGVDSLHSSDRVISGGAWWRDGVSSGLAATILGGIVWYGAWSILERAAAIHPEHEYTAPARRRLLGSIVMISTLIAAGFAVVSLWEIFQHLLGAGNDGSTVDWILKDAMAVLVASGLAVYHGRIFLRERRQRTARVVPLRISALLQPAAEDSLAELIGLTGHAIEIGGYLPAGTSSTAVTISVLAEQIATLKAAGSDCNGLLVLGPAGGVLYAYTKTDPRPALPVGEVDRPKPATTVLDAVS